jgi:L-malate glycosyltransferase
MPAHLPATSGIARVLLILQSAAVGGMETHAIDLAAEYSRRGIRVSVIVPESPLFDGVADRFRSGGARVERLDTDARGGRAAQLQRWLRLMYVSRAVHPDVVHLHTPGATGGLAVLIMARLAARATLIVTEHDLPNNRWGRWDLVNRLLMDRLSDALIAVSRRNARLRVRRLRSAPHQLAAVLNGVPVRDVPGPERDENRRRVRAQFGISAESVVIGSLVRLDQGKGLADLVEGFSHVVAQRPCELLLVGSGPLRAQLEELAASLGVSSHVHFAGNQTTPAPFLDAMDVFALAVPAGSMSIALLEAMERGLPAVITFCGPEEAIVDGETGLCAPPNDPRGFGQVLLRLVSDAHLRTRLGRAAAAHIRRNFSVERVADDLLEIYASARQGAIPARLKVT